MRCRSHRELWNAAARGAAEIESPAAHAGPLNFNLAAVAARKPKGLPVAGLPAHTTRPGSVWHAAAARCVAEFNRGPTRPVAFRCVALQSAAIQLCLCVPVLPRERALRRCALGKLRAQGRENGRPLPSHTAAPLGKSVCSHQAALNCPWLRCRMYARGISTSWLRGIGSSCHTTCWLPRAACLQSVAQYAGMAYNLQASDVSWLLRNICMGPLHLDAITCLT